MNSKEDLYKIILDQQERNIVAFNGVQNALNKINSFNIASASKEEDNYNTIRQLVSSNKSIVSILQWILTAMVTALIFLAGAEKAFNFIKFL